MTSRITQHQLPATAALGGPVVLVVSPHAGHAGRTSYVERMLTAAGIDVGERLLVGELDARRAQGAHWQERGFRAAIAAGGDGTIGAVASHLRGSTLPLGILPMGTANDIARSVGLPMDPEAAARVLSRGHTLPLSVGQTLPALTAPGMLTAEAAQQGNAPLQRLAEKGAAAEVPSPARGAYFLHAMTLGLNVAFARLATDVARRQRWGALTYATSALEALKSYRALDLRITFEGLVYPAQRERYRLECPIIQLTAISTPVFGGNLHLRVPGVDMQDDLLDFLVLEAMEPARISATVTQLLDALRRLRERQHETDELMRRAAGSAEPVKEVDEVLGFALPGMRRFKARAATIESDEVENVTLDGELRARTPAYVCVAPEPVHVLVAPEFSPHRQRRTSSRNG